MKTTPEEIEQLTRLLKRDDIAWFTVFPRDLLNILDDLAEATAELARLRPPAPPAFDPAKARAWLVEDHLYLQVSDDPNSLLARKKCDSYVAWAESDISLGWLTGYSQAIELHGLLLHAIRRDYAEHVAKASAAPAAFDMSKAKVWRSRFTDGYARRYLYVQISATEVMGWCKNICTVSEIERDRNLEELTGQEREAVLAQYRRDTKGEA